MSRSDASSQDAPSAAPPIAQAGGDQGSETLPNAIT